MGLPEQLTSMLFELRAAGSPAAKAQALARAWRFIRRLSPHDRRFLAREAGFEGAEELLDTIAAKRGGVGPAMLLQLLNSVRGRSDQELVSVISSLKDLESREDLLVRSADALAEAFEPEGSEDAEPETAEHSETPGIPPVPVPTVEPEGEPATQGPLIKAMDGGIDEMGAEPEAAPIEEAEAQEPEPETDAEIIESEEPEPLSIVSGAGPEVHEGQEAEAGGIDVAFLIDDLEGEMSLVDRLLCLREAIPALAPGGADLDALVAAFPEGWARRRALTALLEAGLPDDDGEALDLIEDLPRAVDRRWCLGVLIDRGGLQGAEIDRALALSDSSTLHRRVVRGQG